MPFLILCKHIILHCGSQKSAIDLAAVLIPKITNIIIQIRARLRPSQPLPVCDGICLHSVNREIYENSFEDNPIPSMTLMRTLWTGQSDTRKALEWVSSEYIIQMHSVG